MPTTIRGVFFPKHSKTGEMKARRIHNNFLASYLLERVPLVSLDLTRLEGPFEDVAVGVGSSKDEISGDQDKSMQQDDVNDDVDASQTQSEKPAEKSKDKAQMNHLKVQIHH